MSYNHWLSGSKSLIQRSRWLLTAGLQFTVRWRLEKGPGSERWSKSLILIPRSWELRWRSSNNWHRFWNCQSRQKKLQPPKSSSITSAPRSKERKAPSMKTLKLSGWWRFFRPALLRKPSSHLRGQHWFWQIFVQAAWRDESLAKTTFSSLDRPSSIDFSTRTMLSNYLRMCSKQSLVL